MKRFFATLFAALFAVLVIGAPQAQAGTGTDVTYCPPAGTTMVPNGTTASSGFSTWYNRKTPRITHITWVFDEAGCTHQKAYKSVAVRKTVKNGVAIYKWQYAKGVKQRWVTVNVINPARPKMVIAVPFDGQRTRLTSNDLPFFKVKGKDVPATVMSITFDYRDRGHKSYTFGYEAYPEEGGPVS